MYIRQYGGKKFDHLVCENLVLQAAGTQGGDVADCVAGAGAGWGLSYPLELRLFPASGVGAWQTSP